MKATLTTTLAAAAIFAAAGLSGCGGDDEAKAPAPSTPVEQTTPMPPSPAEQASATPTQKWVKNACAKLADEMTALQPPEIAGTTPEESQASLVKFFSGLQEQMGKQSAALREIGPPPGPNAKREFEEAVADLDKVEKRIAKVVAKAKAADATSKAELDSLVGELGTTLKAMSDYEGPVAQMLKTKSLGKALAAEPACAALTPTGQVVQ